jgi:hypothetical protein
VDIFYFHANNAISARKYETFYHFLNAFPVRNADIQITVKQQYAPPPRTRNETLVVSHKSLVIFNSDNEARRQNINNDEESRYPQVIQQQQH